MTRAHISSVQSKNIAARPHFVRQRLPQQAKPDRTAVERSACRASPRAGFRSSAPAQPRFCVQPTRRARCGCSRRETTAGQPGPTSVPLAADSWTAIASDYASPSARELAASSPPRVRRGSTDRREVARARRSRKWRRGGGGGAPRAQLEQSPVLPRAGLVESATALAGDVVVARLASASVQDLLQALRARLEAIPALLGDDPWARRA